MLPTILILIGLLIRYISIKQMGNFSLAVNDVDDIKVSGLYALVRHPSYVGSLFVFAGLILLSIHLALMYMVFVFYFARAIQEESILMNNDKYKEYVKQTGMFLPKFKLRK